MSLNNSTGLERILTLSNIQRQIKQDSAVRKEYLVLSILKLANMDEKNMPELASEIIQVRRLLSTKTKLNLQEVEKKVIDLINGKKTEELTYVTLPQLIQRAQVLANDSMADEVMAYHFFHVLFQEDMFPLSLRDIFTIKQDTPIKEIVSNEEIKTFKKILNNIAEEKKKSMEEKKKEEQPKTPETILELFDLKEKINQMSEYILKNVKGQDQAVSSLVRGYWNAELASFDTSRKGPKAIFTFAGPPGVGKTYLAEQLAEFLGIKHMIVDMSQCSDDDAGIQIFQGIQDSYKGKDNRGEVTKFVKEHPQSILIFDEVEKAHTNVLYLFYQILGQGTLEDLYLKEEISFKDTIIIFTTNVGHNLYEGKEEENLSLLPTKKIVQAMKTDINPLTEKPFFPSALVSRMASGVILMFNHLQYHYLEEICSHELDKQKALFEKQYHIDIEFDEKLPSLLLYREGGLCDARTITGQTKAFFSNEIYQFLQLYENHQQTFIDNVHKIVFSVDDWNRIGKLDKIFERQEKEEILIFNNNTLGNSLAQHIKDYDFSITSDVDEAMNYFEQKDFQMVLLDMFAYVAKSNTMEELGAIDIKASIFDGVRKFVENITEKYPYIPIYVLEKQGMTINDQLLQQLIEMGVRGKMSLTSPTVTIYKQQIEKYLHRAYLQGVASQMISRRKVIKFDVSSSIEEKIVYLRCRNYELEDLVDVEDDAFIVSDIERPTIKFSDVIGASSAKKELQFFMNYLSNPKKFLAKGLKPPKGILFYGPPGTGKTMLAKAMAGESDITFISESASNIISNPSLNGAEAIRNIFKRARKYAPAILFIDEIDAIGRTRTGMHVGTETALNTLLTELDGFKVDLRKPVFLISATNFSIDEKDGPKSLDSALVRRFDRHILIDLPSKEERYALLKMLCAKLDGCLVTDKTLQNVASRSLGLSNAVLTNVVNTAARDAQHREVPITDELFIDAFEITVHGEVKDWGVESLERTAFHEAGHAYMYWKNGQTPSYLTIVSRGNHGGYMQKDEDEARALSKTKKELLNDIRVALAGRASEMIHYGKEDGISTGISSDLRYATQVARYMLSYYGMNEDFGFAFIDDEMMKTGEMSMKIHQEVSEILKEQMQLTLDEINQDFHLVKRLANALIEKTSLTGEEIKGVLEDNA